MAMMPPPPTRFSTTICWPSASREPRRHQAAGHVDVAAGGERNQELDRPVGPILGAGRAGEGQERKDGEGGAEEAPARRVGAMDFHARTLLRPPSCPQPSRSANGCCVRPMMQASRSAPAGDTGADPPTPPQICCGSRRLVCQPAARRAAGAPPPWCRRRASSGCASRRHAARSATWRWRGPGPSRAGSW